MMAEPTKTDAMNKAEAKGFATNPHGGKEGQQPGQSQPEQTPAKPSDRPLGATGTGREGKPAADPNNVGSTVGPHSHQTADQVMGLRSRVMPAGMSVGGLADIYASIRDGNYYTALKFAVGVLNNLLNSDGTSGLGMETPGRNVVRAAAVPGLGSDEQMAKHQDIARQLSDWCEQTVDHPASRSTMSQEVGVARINVSQLATIVQLILQMIGSFQGSGSGQQPE